MIGTYFLSILLGTPTIFFAWLKGLDAQKRELAEGYTTMQAVFQNAEQRDSKTGVVVREAGRPFLSRQELTEARLRAVKADHE